ncbi:hypothetical protein FRC02_010085 [Tulasnella sp. 418]|nr:hypothetical protein FRC02_010085 [Tulasnella sp. 418]
MQQEEELSRNPKKIQFIINHHHLEVGISADLLTKSLKYFLNVFGSESLNLVTNSFVVSTGEFFDGRKLLAK